MARGNDERHNDARIVSMQAWKMRNHPAYLAKQKKETISEDSDPTPPHGIPRPKFEERETREEKYKNGWYN